MERKERKKKAGVSREHVAGSQKTTDIRPLLLLQSPIAGLVEQVLFSLAHCSNSRASGLSMEIELIE